ncbi:hypothetical protein FQN52_004981 [Onygenales sp. PD_12]|nr:hypothetical protein FQN52_004981 [Onygenales sp. PD_12]
MAFRLPTHPPQRQQSYSGTQPASLQIPPASSYPSQPQHQDDESTEWILFSPSQADSTTARTHTTSTERTPRTAGLSRFSDFGSLDTAAQSDDELDEEEELEEDNNTELDSLDDGLHAFREPAVHRAESALAGPDDSAILPAHDGLGMFAASSQDVQNQLWQHEQYNPRRRGEVRPRRRSSVQRHLETVEEMEAREVERDRWQRIEQWRMEQSRALLQEIEKETRRRRNSRASRASLASERLVARQSAKSDVVEAAAQADLVSKTSDEPPAEPQDDAAADESFWRRITRKVIRDLIGIDDSLLSVILGESIVHEDGETEHAKQDGVSTPNAQKSSMEDEPQRPFDMDQMMKDAGDASQSDSYWHERLLERIARELGILVHQLCEHPGAFSTYIRNSASISNQYAGIPISHPSSNLTPSTSRPFPLSRSTSNNTSNLASTYSPQFAPTLQDTAASKHAALFGIEEEGPLFAPTHLSPNQPLPPTAPHSATAETVSEAARLERERDYWERELDIKMVFHFLRSRFSKNIPFTNNDNSTNNITATTSSPRRRSSTTTSTHHGQQDPSQRAAIIRQHHPLVARAHARSQSHIQRPMNNTWATSVSSSAAAGGSPILRHHIRRASSSCASQSAKLSAKRTMAGSASGSSRHYWDIGGSVGSGSVVVSAVGGGMGGWGDV